MALTCENTRDTPPPLTCGYGPAGLGARAPYDSGGFNRTELACGC